MDIKAFAEASVQGIPLLFVVLGLVTLWGKFGLKGKAQLASSLVTGLVLGMLYQMSVVMPAGFAGWFAAAFYGLGLGIVATGAYETLKKFVGASLPPVQ